MPADIDIAPLRAEIALLQRFDHGPSDATVQALSGAGEVVNLSTNESAWPPSPAVGAAVIAAMATAWRYPDPASAELRAAIAGRLLVADDRVVCGTGSECLIEIVARMTLAPGDSVLVSPPTFPIYAQAARLLGARVAEVPRRPDFSLDVGRLLSALTDDVRILFVCNPNNPTGTPVPAAELRAIAAAAGPRCLLVVDEAYHEFAALEAPTRTLELLDQAGAPYVVLRTFSKAYALGGFRVGYAVTSDARIAAGMDLARTQFPVSTLASVAALAAWNDQPHLQRTVAATRATRAGLVAGLAGAGIAVPESAANFVFVPTGPATADAYQRLLRAGIVVRPAGTAGLRVTVGSQAQCARFLEAVQGGALA